MKSFGLWYLANGNEGDTFEVSPSPVEGNSESPAGNKESVEKNEKPEFELHVNF